MTFYGEDIHREIITATEGKNLAIEVYFCIPRYFDRVMLTNQFDQFFKTLQLPGPIVYHADTHEPIADVMILVPKEPLAKSLIKLKQYIKPYIMNSVIHMLVSILANGQGDKRVMTCELRFNTRCWRVTSMSYYHPIPITDPIWVAKVLGINPQRVESPRVIDYERDSITFYSSDMMEGRINLERELSGVLITGFIDQEDGKDVLYIVLLYNSQLKEWEFPNCELNRQSSIKTSNLTLLERDTHMTFKNVITYANLAYFDQHRTHVSFILVNDSPCLVAGKRIGIPINRLVEMSHGFLKVPSYEGEIIEYGLLMQHQLIFRNIISSPKLSKVLNSIYQVSPDACQYSPSECSVCAELLVESRTLCKNGHILCGICATKISSEAGARCPMCRSFILSKTISNQLLDHFVMSEHPKEYSDRLQKIGNSNLNNFWLYNKRFQGKKISYHGRKGDQ